jgi:toxin secretion/phage lysis holin
MPDKAVEFKGAVTAAFALVTGLLGASGVAVVIFIVCMVLDYITGSLAARAHGEWSSTIAREGLWHKLGEIVALLVAALCDIAVKVILTTAAAPVVGEVHYAGYLTLIVSIWYILTELGSILENAAKLGAPIPDWLIKGVGRLKKKVDKSESEKLPDEQETEE